MMLLLLMTLLLHPGHMTRVEARASDDGRSLEVSMRIDVLDLESALKRREKGSINIEKMVDADAKRMIVRYLNETISLGEAVGDQKPTTRVQWVGWEKHPRHVWLHFELPLPTTDLPTANKANALPLIINTLYEVEAELQHVVVLDANLGGNTIIVSQRDQAIRLP
jgi:hypothetical protein